MKFLGKLLAFVIAAPIVLLIGAFVVATIYSHWFTYVHHFRLTVEIETPEGIKSASSVLKAVYVESPKWVPQNTSLSTGLHGEAVFVDLGGGKNIVALLALGANGEQSMEPNLAARALRGEGPEKMLPSFWYRDAPHWTGAAELTGELVPTFATFDDPTKPETVRVIVPSEFERMLGAGYRFKRVWVEMTDDGVTSHSSRTLSWLGDREAPQIFWKALYASGFRPSASTEAITLLVR